MPACTNCGGEEFVWADSVGTGTFARSPLSLRRRGELGFRSRVCVGCGRAELFVKDVGVLKDPARWAPGEFQSIPKDLPPEPAWKEPEAPPRPETTARAVEAEAPAVPTGEAKAEPVAEAKRAPRRRAASRGKSTGPPLIHD